jgi:drug/metabolite transporter (DMT)-like permease
VADACVKFAAGKLPDSLGLLLYGSVPFATGLVWFLTDRARGAGPAIEGRAVLAALGVGAMFMLVTLAMYAAFRRAAPISLLSPVVRLGGLLVASGLGFILWKEPLTARYLAGLALAGAGVYLLVTR